MSTFAYADAAADPTSRGGQSLRRLLPRRRGLLDVAHAVAHLHSVRWLLMGGRGVPYDTDPAVAMSMAVERVRRYKGAKPVFTETQKQVVHDIVLSALSHAPQPLGDGWVHTSLMAVGGLVRWAISQREPLDREHLLSEYMRNRFLAVACTDVSDNARLNYRTRLDFIATALTSTEDRSAAPASTRTLNRFEPLEPHDQVEVAELWLWAEAVTPQTRRDRMVATLILILGCGLRGWEVGQARPEHVTGDADGAHITVVDRHGSQRVVTCHVGWEDRLTALVEATPPGRMLAQPWRSDPVEARTANNFTALAQRTHLPPVWFSNTSLRNTWLVEHLTSGTPLPTLLNAAGLASMEAVKPFLRFVPTPTAAERAAVLRGTAHYSDPTIPDRGTYRATQPDSQVEAR